MNTSSMASSRRKSLSCSFVALIGVLWLISVCTEWSYQETIQQILDNQYQEIKSPTPSVIPVSQLDPLALQTSLDLATRNNNDDSFVCHTAPTGSNRHLPIVIVANARTGSNLFFSFLKNLAAEQKAKVNVLQLYEIFGEDEALLVQVVSQIVDQIRRGCGWNTQDLYATRAFATLEQIFAAARAEFQATPSQQQVVAELQTVVEQRFEHPAALMQFLHRVPSASPNPYFVLKVFPYHVQDKLNLSVADFLAKCFAHIPKTQYVILWRRNMLEIFVSFQIAVQQQKWTNVGTTHEDAVTIEPTELAWFVEHTTDFYRQARDYFTSHALSYETFEYDRDLRDETQHFHVVQRIQTQLFRQPSQDGDELLRQVLDHPGTAKQALVPLSKQIVNWNDVASWGYSESVEEWPDLFAETAADQQLGTVKNSGTVTALQQQPAIFPIGTVNVQGDDNAGFDFICDPPSRGHAKPHQPILIVANARTGSNLFFAFIKNLASKQASQVDVLNLYEFFGDDMTLLARMLSRIIDQVQQGCGWDTVEKKALYADRMFSSPEDVLETALSQFGTSPSQRQVIEELQRVISQRLGNPSGVLDFIHRIPSRLPQAYFVLKVFPDQVTRLMKTTIPQFVSLFSKMQTQYVILWRRNMLEIFVSFQIAKQMKKWTNVGTTEENAVQVDRADLEQFIRKTTQYYWQARDYFASNSIPYQEFEYDRDLGDDAHQFNVIKRIQIDLLHQPYDEMLLQGVVNSPTTAKQALVPLSTQIVNWNDVESWGYSESSEEWPEILALPSDEEPQEGESVAQNELAVAKTAAQNTWKQLRPGGKVDFQYDGFNFVCDTTQNGAKPHQPILMVANARTGSNLFFAFIKNLASKQESEVDVLNLYEFFGDDDVLIARVLSRILDQIQHGCGWDIAEKKLYADRKFTSPDGVLETALDELGTSPSQRQVIEELQHVISRRLDNPSGVLDFIHRIPSHLPQAYFVMKVFPDQVTRLMRTTISHFVSLLANMKTQYVILWRRNMLEIFVSFQIAKQRKKWTNVGTTEDDAIQVDRAELEQFIEKTARFYKQARDYFASNSIPYQEFEYDRDLSDEQHHFNVVQRIQTDLLHQPDDEQLLRSVLDPPGLEKQAVVPLSKQIVNWNDVESWGYSESSEEWPDLFS